MTTATFDPSARRSLIVTAHPNHELAVLGFVQRAEPFLLFLTDGGHPRRVAETESALADLGLLDRACFLGWPESRLYEALLAGEREPFAELTRQIGAAIDRCAPLQVLAEAVELYNPLHDVTTPLVRAALAARPGIHAFEFPLIAQSRRAPEEYRLQRLPEARRDERIELRLSARELAIKLHARRERYAFLREQMGPVLETAPDEHFGIEEFAPMRATLPAPGDDLVLRYEWRARRLQDAGAVREVITYADHFLPFVRALSELREHP